VNFLQLKSLFVQAGCTRLYAKPLAENDNSKNQVYFAGAVEALNVFPSEEVFAENTKKGPSFKARLKFGWLLDNGDVAPAPDAQLILYSQYPEVRFSGFLQACKAGPSQLMADRQRAKKFPPDLAKQLVGRILFLGVTPDRRTLGYVASGTSQIASEFKLQTFPQAFVVFYEVPLPFVAGATDSRAELLAELRRIHRLGWIDSKQLDSDGQLKPCQAPQCGGFTLEAELGIPKNSDVEPDFLGWEVKQYAVMDFERIESAKPITLLTPEPDGGFYEKNDAQAFVRKFGYADKSGIEDRLNFGGRHVVGHRCPPTGLTMKLIGFDIATGDITDANGEIALVSDADEVAASWSFKKIFKHWSHKHTKAVYVPSQRRIEPKWQYAYGHKLRLAQGTDSLRLLRAFAAGAMYYDPGIKLEHASTKPKIKPRSQFRVASKNIAALYAAVETVEL
jgi:MvaI/BcnI restriction endonuclease family